ncbi:MAG: hypothetical protein LWW93_02335 [Hyphomicrobiales bacterium]|nr:hypothetical protein [Hyphomicrobiales bacterium]
MRILTAFALVSAFGLAFGPAEAKGLGGSSSHYVRPYVTSRGTVVQGHQQTNPNHTRADNWSTKGNVNPYTGKPGTKPLYPR